MESGKSAHVNHVRIVGRLADVAQPRELPSGDTVCTLRASVDTLDCAAWPASLRRRVVAWRPGDLVEVEGAVRRRFFRSGGAVASRVEIELSAARMVRRARPPATG